MRDFSPTEAALEGLRLTRERPLAVLWWWAAYVAAVLVQFCLGRIPVFSALDAGLATLQTQSTTLQQNPDNVAAANAFAITLGHVMPPALIFSAAVLLTQMVLSTAVLRAVLRPAETKAGYLRLSIDELRQFGLALVVLAAFLAYTFGVLMVSALVLSILGGLIGGMAPVVMAPLTALILVAAYVYPAVRLSLAPAMTLADGRISFIRAWRLTQGRFWPLFGAYAIAILLSLALSVAAGAIDAVVTLVFSHSTEPPRPELMRDLSHPLPIILVLLNALFSALIGAVVTAPIASAFRQITGRVGAPPPPRAGSTASPWDHA